MRRPDAITNATGQGTPGCLGADKYPCRQPGEKPAAGHPSKRSTDRIALDFRRDVLKFRAMARALVLLAAALLSFALGVTASADPPDPTWLSGFWDDDDQDNAIIAILAIRAVVASANLNLPDSLPIAPFVAAPTRSGIAAPVYDSVDSRAPPLAPPHLV